MFIQKWIETEFNNYLLEVEIEESSGFYELRIYEGDPYSRFLFVFEEKEDPIISSKFKIEVSPVVKAIELLQSYELKFQHERELNNWDGRITHDTLIVTDNKVTEEQRKQVKKLYYGPKVHDWEEKISGQQNKGNC